MMEKLKAGPVADSQAEESDDEPGDTAELDEIAGKAFDESKGQQEIF